MSSTWFVETDFSPQELFNELIPNVFEGDRMLITELAPGYHGWLPSKAWDWIRRYQQRSGEVGNRLASP